MVSITGEKLHLNQIQAAIREAEERSRLEVWQFRIIPDVEHSRYELLLESYRGLDDDSCGAAFIAAFDQALSRLNIEYASKRSSRRLGSPRLHLMRSGWSERASRADFRGGKREAQYKWQTLRLEWDDLSRGEIIRTIESEAQRAGGAAPSD